jgi:O-antigen ligase
MIAILQFLMQQSLNLGILGEQALNAGTSGVAKIDMGGEKYIRAYGTFPHPNVLSAFLTVACATAIYGYISSKELKTRALYAFALFILILGNFLTFSRAGLAVSYVTMAGILVFLWFKGSAALKPTLKRLFITILLLSVLFIAVLFPYLRARTTGNIPTPYNRTYYNRLGLDIIKAHPVLGVGPGNMLREMRARIQPTEEWQVQPPHNFLIEVACETGLIGLGIFLFLYIYLVIKLLKNTTKTGDSTFNIVLLFVLFAILLLMFFDHYFYTIQQTQFLLWIIIGLSIRQVCLTNKIVDPKHL